MIDDSPLRIQTRRTSTGAITLALAGDLDFDTAEDLVDHSERTFEAGVTSLVVDLSGLYICDSSGLSALIHLSQDARRAGAELSIVGITPQLRRILEVTGLDSVLGVAPADPVAVHPGSAGSRS